MDILLFSDERTEAFHSHHATHCEGKDEPMKKYECDVCGYVYDPANGDPDNSVQPGTAFQDIPDDWVCPECGAPKDQFSPLEE